MKPQLPADTLVTNNSFYEQIRDHILKAVYEKDLRELENLLAQCFEKVSKHKRLSENTQKVLTQILVILKQFRNSIQAAGDDKFHTLSRKLKAILSSATKEQTKSPLYISFKIWTNHSKLSSEQINLIFKTAMNFQLSTGCSNYCRRCNEWALPGTRAHFSFECVIAMLDIMDRQNNDEISLYAASDPLDWQEKEKSITDIVRHIKTLPIEYSLLSKVPKGKQQILAQLLDSKANLSVSVTSKNKERIGKIESSLEHPLFKQHDSDDLLIPAGLDEDFQTVKPSITDGYGTEVTPDGAFIIIPTFTSALHPFGHKKIAVTTETGFFPEKKTGRHALLVDYFKPLKGFDLKNSPCTLNSLIDVQIESILLDNGEYNLTPPGMRSTREYLSIFDEKARIRRKKMTISVMRRLKKQYLENTSFKNLKHEKRAIYLKTINTHCALCRKSHCRLSKLLSVSFFLESIQTYIQSNPTKTAIVQFLAKDEIKQLESISMPSSAEILENKFSKPDPDSFNIFRKCIFELLKNSGKNKQIYDFTEKYKSVYDPVTDVFVVKTSDSDSHKMFRKN